MGSTGKWQVCETVLSAKSKMLHYTNQLSALKASAFRTEQSGELVKSSLPSKQTFHRKRPDCLVFSPTSVCLSISFSSWLAADNHFQLKAPHAGRTAFYCRMVPIQILYAASLGHHGRSARTHTTFTRSCSHSPYPHTWQCGDGSSRDIPSTTFRHTRSCGLKNIEARRLLGAALLLHFQFGACKWGQKDGTWLGQCLLGHTEDGV